MRLGVTQLFDMITCKDVSVLGTHIVISESTRDLGAVIDCKLSLPVHVTAVCWAGYNQLRQLRPVVCLLSVQTTLPPRRLFRHSSSVAWTTATHCCMTSMTGCFTLPSQYILQHAWSSVLVEVTRHTTATAAALSSSPSASHFKGP